MHPRAVELIGALALEPHPEGGMYRRTWQSAARVRPDDARGARAALTVIYYLLVDRGISRWHRVLSDESWHWYEGAPLQLFTAPAGGGAIASRTLGPLSSVSAPHGVVAAGCWQAARCSGDYTLVGCCVAPGFEFDDFVLIGALAESDRPRLAPASLYAELL